MKYTLLAIALLFSLHLSAQDKDTELQSKIEFFNSKIQQTEKGERFKWMDSLYRSVWEKTAFKYDSIARKTIDYAIKLDSLRYASNRLSDLMYYHIYIVNQPKEVIDLFDNYTIQLEQLKNDYAWGKLYLYTGDGYLYTNNLDKAIAYYKKAAGFGVTSKKEKLVALAKLYLGFAQSDKGLFAEASMSFKEASQIYTKLKDTANLLGVKNGLSILYSRNAFYEEASKVRYEAIEIAKDINSVGQLMNLYYNAAEDFKRTGDKVKQIEYLKASLDAIKNDNREANLKPAVLASLINAFAEADSLELADMNFKELEGIYEKDKTSANRRQYIKAKKTLLFVKGEYNGALKYAKEYLELQIERKNTDNIMNAEKYLSKIYKAMGDPKGANTHLVNYYSIKDSISSVQNVKSLAYYQTLYETEKRDLEIIKQDSEIKQLESDKVIENNKKNARYTILISALLLMAGIAYYLLDRAKRKRKIIAEQLMRSKKELDDFTKQLLVKSKEQDVLKKEFNSLKSLYGEKEELVELQELADSKILTNEDWDNFKLKFKSVYAHFFINFKNQGFKFSDSEERLVALEKLSLKTNEIANMLAISPDSVHTARYRLRKKLNIPKNVDIIEFLNL